MYLVEQTALDAGDLPIAELRGHLRLGTGFADDSVQDPVLARAMLAAVAQIEAMTAKAVIRRGFVWTVSEWREAGRQLLPRAPLVSIDAVAMVDGSGGREVLDLDRVHVEFDTHRPSLVAKGFILPRIPFGGRAEVSFTAGFGADWSDVPNDLSLAIFSLAAGLYESRIAPGEMPDGVKALIAPYRETRFLRGFR